MKDVLMCRRVLRRMAPALLLVSVPFLGLPTSASAQDSSIWFQCPSTPTDPGVTGRECVHLVAGDGAITMADDRRLYIFGFAEIDRVDMDGDRTAPPDAPNYDDVAYPGWVMSQGTLAAEFPGSTLTVEQDSELYLTLTNVGMAMRPDLFDPHSIHWHGFPNAAAIFDGVPDASVSINMGASFTYYYRANDPGTYMYHCHVEATEHMQMGMLGNLYVRPRQDRCDTLADDANKPGSVCPAGHVDGVTRYAYNDGDGSTAYDVAVPIQMASFDAEFHDASLNVQPLPFGSMLDTYFMLNGRGYPDTVDSGPMSTLDYLGRLQRSQPVSSLVTANVGDRILLRVSNLNVTMFNTLATSGIPMRVVGIDARLLRDDAGANTSYETQSVTLGGGQSADIILDTAGLSAGTYFLYSTNLHQLANGEENFGGMMTHIVLQ